MALCDRRLNEILLNEIAVIEISLLEVLIRIAEKVYSLSCRAMHQLKPVSRQVVDQRAAHFSNMHA